MVTLQEQGVGEGDIRQGEAAAAELLLRPWDDVQEPQALVEEEGGSQNQASEEVVGDH